MTATHLDEHHTRLLKLEQLKHAGVIPYANNYARTHSIAELVHKSEQYTLPDVELLMQDGAANTYSLAGRMILFRTMGKLSFAQLRDGSGDIQIAFVKSLCSFNTGKEIGESFEIAEHELSAYKIVEKYIDVGDFIGVKGELFVTKHGELTLFVNEFQLLSKALRPLGDKWHGIKDEEMIYRQRYLDMTINNESYERMLLRSNFIKTLREFYWSHDFIELDTPILGNSASGAAATPFVTHHEDFGADMYLRIAPEIALKMATVGRLERVFEIGKDFRNEGSSPSHHQEFLVAEHYAVYWNYEDNMRFTEQMFDYLFAHLPSLKKVVHIADKEGVTRAVDFSTPRQRIDYIAQIQKDSGIDVAAYGPEDEDLLRATIKNNGFDRVGIETQATATMIDYLYKKVTRPKIVGPAFIYNYPKTMQPLARQADENSNIVEQFQVIVNGREILKAYSELVDPVIQQQNFDDQSAAANAGDSEATKSDDAFVHAMEYGMPPQSGRGMGIDRILTMLTEQQNIRDVIMFPMMKDEHTEEGNIKSKAGKSKETKVAVALVNTGIGLELWQQLNTIAHLNAALGARVGTGLLMQDTITTQDNTSIKLNIQHAIMIKEIDSSDAIRKIISQAKEKGLEVTEFTREMIDTTDDRKVIEQTKNKSYQEIEYLGVLLFGNKKDVEAITKECSLYTGNSSTAKSNDSQPPTIVTNIPTDLPGTEQALQLIDTYLTDTKRHCLQVGEIMRACAKELGEDEHYRWLAGALHDIDRDHIAKDADKHLKDEFDSIMASINAPELLKNDIKSHGDRLTGVPVDSLIRKYLSAIDELSGFLYAYSLMRPTGFDGMEVKGAMKRMKDKTFAAGIDRTHLRNCEKYLNIPIEEFTAQVISIMQKT